MTESGSDRQGASAEVGIGIIGAGHFGAVHAEALREVSTSPVVYAEIPHAQHAFDFYYGSPRAHYTAQAVEEFLSWVMATRKGENALRIAETATAQGKFE